MAALPTKIRVQIDLPEKDAVLMDLADVARIVVEYVEYAADSVPPMLLTAYETAKAAIERLEATE
jgi:hypothetical protein